MNLARILLYHARIVLIQHLCKRLLRIGFLVLPVVNQIMIGYNQIHIRRIICRLIDPHLPLPGRMQRAGNFGGFIRKLIQARQKNDQKCHIIVEQHLSFCTTVGFESLAQSAVICLICLPVLLCHDLLIDIYVTEHSKFSFALPDQLLLMNSLLHFGQVIQILPLPFGTRTLCLHPGHLKKR